MLQVMKDPQKYLWVSKKLAVSDSQPVGTELEMPGCIKGDDTLLLGKNSSRDQVLCESYWKAL